MSAVQIQEAKSLIGTMPREEIAAAVGTSLPSLKRAFPGTRLAYFNRYVINPQLVRKVCEYYEQHGRKKTEEAFPDVSVRSIVERYKNFRPRQTRWTDKEIIEAARMAGLISAKSQAKYFDRPNAHAGAIKSLWMKRFGFGQGNINGMVHDNAKHLVNHRARYIKPMGESRTGRQTQFRRLILWVDMERCLKPEVPKFLVDAIRTMADFQRWLHDAEDPRPKILRMIKQREFV